MSFTEPPRQGVFKGKLVEIKPLKQLLFGLPVTGYLVNNQGKWMIKMNRQWNNQSTSDGIERITKDLFETDIDCSCRQKYLDIWSQEIGEKGEPFWMAQSNMDTVYGAHISLVKYRHHKKARHGRPKRWREG
eukprot:378970_1